MPELPEVENVKLGLIDMGSVGQAFVKIEFLRAGLRTPFPKKASKSLEGQSVRAIHRRAKYLLFETEAYYLLSHLGMTGNWRKLETDELIKHDHVILHFGSGLRLVFNDPRRFGVFDVFAKELMTKNKWLKNLGVEPLEDTFTGEYVFKKSRKVTASIKAFLMDQRRIVGVGNIYASESLFCSKIKPTRRAGKITRDEAGLLAGCVREILLRAIQAGGSTIRDYRNSQGGEGSFQAQFMVYDRAGEPCLRCRTPLKSKFITGRNTFWCPKCQR